MSPIKAERERESVLWHGLNMHATIPNRQPSCRRWNELHSQVFNYFCVSMCRRSCGHQRRVCKTVQQSQRHSLEQTQHSVRQTFLRIEICFTYIVFMCKYKRLLVLSSEKWMAQNCTAPLTCTRGLHGWKVHTGLNGFIDADNCIVVWDIHLNGSCMRHALEFVPQKCYELPLIDLMHTVHSSFIR